MIRVRCVFDLLNEWSCSYGDRSSWRKGGDAWERPAFADWRYLFSKFESLRVRAHFATNFQVAGQGYRDDDVTDIEAA